MGAAIRALVALGLVALSACGSVHTQSAAQNNGSVPWVAIPAGGVFPTPPNPTPTAPDEIPSNTPECTAGQLEAMVVSRGGGAGGHTNAPLLFRNKAQDACYLEGFPDVTILSSAGKPLASAAGQNGRGTFFDPVQVVVRILMRPGTPALLDQPEPNPRGQTWINVEWFDCAQPTAARIWVDLPDRGGRMVIPFAVRSGYNPTCDGGPGPRSGVSRSQFNPTGVPWPPEPSYIPIQLSIDAPARASRGSTLVYYVTITNTSEADYSLNPCPDYAEFLGQKVVALVYRLNCVPVGDVKPGENAKFEMRMGIPASLSLGSYVLSWSLEDGRITSHSVTASVEVTG